MPNYVSVASQAERDHFRYLRRETRARVQRSCAGEMEREVHAILGPVGVDEKIGRQVADALLALEDDLVDSEALNESTSTSSRWLNFSVPWRRKQAETDDREGGLKFSQDVGLTAFLLKFGEGLGAIHPCR